MVRSDIMSFTSEVKEKFITYLEVNGHLYIDRGSKVSHSCINPEHDDASPSAFTILKEGEEFCYCSSCGFALNTVSFYKLLDVGFDEKMMFERSIKNLLKESDGEGEDTSTEIYLPVQYKAFTKEYRMISPETFTEVGAYYCEVGSYYQKRIIIPIKDIDGINRSFEAISTSKKMLPKVLRPKNIKTHNLFGFENLVKTNTIFICEGIFNALSFKEIGYDGVINFGVATIKNKVRKLLRLGVKNVIIAGDNDDVGHQFNRECYKILIRNNFNVSYFSFPQGSVEKFDVNDLHKSLGSVRFKGYVDNILHKQVMIVKDL